jgi:hypothetical protein
VVYLGLGAVVVEVIAGTFDFRIGVSFALWLGRVAVVVEVILTTLELGIRVTVRLVV